MIDDLASSNYYSGFGGDVNSNQCLVFDCDVSIIISAVGVGLAITFSLNTVIVSNAI